MREVGLPDDYEYDEDLQEVERRQNLSFRERQREDVILVDDSPEITQRSNAMMMEEDSMIELGNI